MERVTSVLEKRAPYLCCAEAEFQDRNSPGPNLHLTVRFSEDTLSFGPIRVRIAISKAYLNFYLSNCRFPLACDLEQVWKRTEKAKTIIKKRSTQKRSEEDQASLSVSAMPSAKVELSEKEAEMLEIETKSEVTTQWQHVFWRGNTEKPSLVFNALPTREFLSGTLLNGDLVGSIEPKEGRFYQVSISLEIPKSGLLVEDGSTLSSYPNKKGIIKIIAALALCRKPIPLHERYFGE